MIAFAVPCYRVDSGLGGVGLRVWELAQVLGRRMEVTILAKEASDLAAPGVRFCDAGGESWREVIAECTAAVFYDLPDTRMMLAAHRAGKLVISEASVPIEHLHYHGIRQAPAPDDAYQDLVARFRLQLLVSDHFIVRSRVARATLVAGLSLAGRLGYLHFDASPELAHLCTSIPIGYNRASAEQAERACPALPAVDFVWSGGLWDYYDAAAAVAAVARTRDRGRPVTLRFMYLPPEDQVLGEGWRMLAARAALGVEDLVDVCREPIPHDRRDGVLKSARAALCLARPGIENETAVRLRLRDTFLYGLPLVVDRHGATGDLVRALGLGLTVDSRDPDEVAAALSTLTEDEALYEELVANIQRARAEVVMDDHVAGLVDVVETRRRAPDAGTREHGRLVAELLARHPAIEEAPRYPF